MNRREFLGMTLAAGGALPAARALAQPEKPSPKVKTVLVMFKCHFDLGFVDTQAGIMRKYFKEYFPQAIQIAKQVRETGTHPNLWTTGSWLLYEYLEQANAEERSRMEQAIQAGDIAWHALPFSWQSELLDPSLVTGAIGLSKSLDRRFNRTTTGAKMTDVPGH